MRSPAESHAQPAPTSPRGWRSAHKPTATGAVVVGWTCASASRCCCDSFDLPVRLATCSRMFLSRDSFRGAKWSCLCRSDLFGLWRENETDPQWQWQDCEPCDANDAFTTSAPEVPTKQKYNEKRTITQHRLNPKVYRHSRGRPSAGPLHRADGLSPQLRLVPCLLAPRPDQASSMMQEMSENGRTLSSAHATLHCPCRIC